MASLFVIAQGAGRLGLEVVGEEGKGRGDANEAGGFGRHRQAASKARSVGRDEEEGDTMLQSASHPSAQIFSDG